MKHIILTLILTLISFPCTLVLSQQANAMRVKGKGYNGYAFSENHFVFGLTLNEMERQVTPTKEDIQKAETILNDSIDHLKGNYSPNIRKKNLKRYERQYVGFVNAKKQIIIYINFLRNIDRKQKSKLGNEILWILDGGDDYWQIFINIDEKKLFGLSINADS